MAQSLHLFSLLLPLLLLLVPLLLLTSGGHARKVSTQPVLLNCTTALTGNPHLDALRVPTEPSESEWKSIMNSVRLVEDLVCLSSDLRENQPSSNSDSEDDFGPSISDLLEEAKLPPEDVVFDTTDLVRAEKSLAQYTCKMRLRKLIHMMMAGPCFVPEFSGAKYLFVGPDSGLPNNAQIRQLAAGAYIGKLPKALVAHGFDAEQFLLCKEDCEIATTNLLDAIRNKQPDIPGIMCREAQNSGCFAVDCSLNGGSLVFGRSIPIDPTHTEMNGASHCGAIGLPMLVAATLLAVSAWA